MKMLSGSWKPTPGENPVLLIVGGLAAVANGVLLFVVGNGWVDLTSESIAHLFGGINLGVATLAAILARGVVVPASQVLDVPAGSTILPPGDDDNHGGA